MSNTLNTDQNKNVTDPLAVFRRADFDWTMHLQSIWHDLPFHVDGLQPEIIREFNDKLTHLKEKKQSTSPLGWVLSGVGGAGKTHLLNNLRADAIRQNCAFILVDMTDVRDFWETVANGYTSSLQEEYATDCTQMQFIVRELIAGMSTQGKTDDNMRAIAEADSATLKKYSQKILKALAKRHRREVTRHQDTVRALVATYSEDFELSNIGQIFLQGLRLEKSDAELIGLHKVEQPPSQIVSALSWIISLSMPAVVAFDQLDPIVRQLEFEAQIGESKENAAQEAVANSIISDIGDGLRSMFDTTRRTLTVLSCLETSWNILNRRVLRSSADRFESPRVLKQLNSSEKYRMIVGSRMAEAANGSGFGMPYPTWPFRPESFETLSNVTPRELLKRCEQHRRECIDARRVNELDSFGRPKPVEPAAKPENEFQLKSLDSKFETLRAATDFDALLDEKTEDKTLASLMVSLCECVLKENVLPVDAHAVIDTQFTGATTTKPLHARIRVVFHSEQEREEHFSLRALQRKNARAFQNRLKFALTQSGIDESLSFRHLTIFRSEEIPSGKGTNDLAERFCSAGGLFVKPSVEDIRTLHALVRMAADKDPLWSEWLKSRRPASQTEFCKSGFAAFLKLCGPDNPSLPRPIKPDPESNPVIPAAPNPPIVVQGPVKPQVNNRNGGPIEVDRPFLADRDLFPLGRKLFAGQPGDALSMPTPLLNKHGVILAGAGSGKTVLLKRIVEEAALRGIPSIVLDGANDLSALGDRWPSRPESWSDLDERLSEEYHNRVEPVIWTPGRRTGNPLQLELLPDLSATRSDPDEFDAAVSMVSGALADLLKLGNGNADQNRRGILSKSLRFYVEQEKFGLSAFIEMLADLPSDAMLGISKESAIAKDLSDRLRVIEETDPMIGGSGEPLDPAVLFGDDQSRPTTRVSIINFSFLPTDQAQLQFVNQLATTLFAWIKKNPHPPGRSLRGLLVIDEAKDLVPSRRSTTCKESLIRLTAQARKYQLGLVYATQNPREIDNTIIGNCSTQYYGKASSPAAIETIKEQITLRNGNGSDIGQLKRGEFYVFNADAEMARPTKVAVPLCLSRHHTLDADAVLQRAVGKEALANASV